MPVSTRTMASPVASAMAIERLRPMAFSDTAPALISSTCLLSTCTAGSAEIMNQPMTMAMGTSSQGDCIASCAPRIVPSEEKPTFTPTRNSTRPT